MRRAAHALVSETQREGLCYAVCRLFRPVARDGRCGLQVLARHKADAAHFYRRRLAKVTRRQGDSGSAAEVVLRLRGVRRLLQRGALCARGGSASSRVVRQRLFRTAIGRSVCTNCRTLAVPRERPIGRCRGCDLGGHLTRVL